MSPKSNKLRFDDFIEALRPDPESLDERFVVLRGFLGKSSERDHVRIYFDGVASSFIDVAESDIVHAVPLSDEESAIGGSRLWFNASSSYLYGDPAKGGRGRDTFGSGRLVRDLAKLHAAVAAFNPFGGSGWLVSDESGFNVECEDPPTIWDVTPCQACDPSCIINPTLTCAPIGPQFGTRSARESGRTGFESFDPYDRR